MKLNNQLYKISLNESENSHYCKPCLKSEEKGKIKLNLTTETLNYCFNIYNKKSKENNNSCDDKGYHYSRSLHNSFLITSANAHIARINKIIESSCSLARINDTKSIYYTDSVRMLSGKIDQPFLRSIKQDYPEFDYWFKKILDQNRMCYFLEKDSDLSALLIYKTEKASEHNLPFVSDDALKLCTFKVSEQIKGHKIGESLLLESFKIARIHKLSHLYLTVFPKHQLLISLLSKFGFIKSHRLNNGEFVMIKNDFA